ncbi:MAG: hypothetical protein ACNA8K_16185 [Cyclonatronaceae bacterium]
MKYSIGILTTATLIAVSGLVGCNSPSDKMDRAETSVIEANQDLEIAKKEVEAELRIYRAKNADRIVDNNRTISDIKKKIEAEPDKEKKARLEKKLAEYEETNRELKREMDNFKASGRENWDNFKDSFTNKMDDLGDSLKDFFSPSATN